MKVELQDVSSLSDDEHQTLRKLVHSYRGWCRPRAGGDTRWVEVEVNALEAGFFFFL